MLTASRPFKTGSAGLFLETVLHLSHILEIDRLAIVGADHQPENLLRGGELARNPKEKTA
jgi:hypothetical protein